MLIYQNDFNIYLKFFFFYISWFNKTLNSHNHWFKIRDFLKSKNIV